MPARAGGNSSSLAELLESYGKVVLVVGAFLEGEAVEALLGQLRRYQLGIFAAITAVGTILRGIRLARRRRQRKQILEQRDSDAPA